MHTSGNTIYTGENTYVAQYKKKAFGAHNLKHTVPEFQEHSYILYQNLKNNVHYSYIIHIIAIMDINFEDEVLSLPFTLKEKLHKSRNRYGYHVFLSMFYSSFQHLTPKQKQKQLLINNITTEIRDDDDVSIDSTDSVPLRQQVTPAQIMRLCAKKWNNYSDSMKTAWNKRAEMLNMQPRNDGRFEVIPSPLLSPNLHDHVKESLSIEWQYLVSIFRF